MTDFEKTFPEQRVYDLLRYCRHQLHEADLINDDELATLRLIKGAPRRLMSYDEMREKVREEAQP